MAWNAFHYQKVTWNRWISLSLDFSWNCSGRPIRNNSWITAALFWILPPLVNSQKEKEITL